MYKHNTEVRWCSHCCWKAISITCSKCVSLATAIQHAVHMCIVASLAVQYYSTSHKWQDFLEKVIKHKMCALISLQLLSETFLILRRIEWDTCMIISVYWSPCKVPVILVRCQLNLNFLDTFSKNTHISNYTKIHMVGSELTHVDGWTDGDMMKVMVAFHSFVYKPKNRKVKIYNTLILPYLLGCKTLYLTWTGNLVWGCLITECWGDLCVCIRGWSSGWWEKNCMMSFIICNVY
jgi:hypothetical protein